MDVMRRGRLRGHEHVERKGDADYVKAYYVGQGSTLAVFHYPEHPRFSDGIPDSPAQ